MYSDDPTSPNYVEDYDYFEVKRKERLLAIGQHKKQIEALQRAELRKKALHWRADGTKALNAVKAGLSGVRFVLEPHHNMKKTMVLYERCVQSMEFDTSIIRYTRHGFPLANRVLHSCSDIEGRQRWFSHKANLIMWKMGVMQEVRAEHVRRNQLTFEYPKRPSDVRVLRHLFRTYMWGVPIDYSVSEELKRKRAHYKVVCAKLQLIYDTQRKCAQIPLCKSRQHTNPNGCSACGVTYIGGMLGGGIPYVESRSRDTGLVTLVTLEFEIETLAKEEVIQKEIVEEVGIDLHAFEEVVCGIVRVNIQAWWSFVLVWKRFKRKQARIELSLQRYKVRRIAAMKRDIDRTIREAPPLDMEHYHDVYYDIWPETQEYAAIQTELKRRRILKWAKRFHKKLKVLVEEARERQYQEYLRLLALPKPPRPIIFRTIKKVDNSHLVCYRLECKMRKFLTRERYDVHMKTHARDDELRYERYDHAAAMRKQRVAREKVVLGRITDSKLRLDDHTEEHGLDGARHRVGSTDGSTQVTMPSASEDEQSVGSGVRLPSASQCTVSEPAQQGTQAEGAVTDISRPSTAATDEQKERKGEGGAEGKEQEREGTLPVVRGATGFAKRKELQWVSDSPEGLAHDSAPHAGDISSPSDVHLNTESAQRVHDWASMAHIYTLHSLINDSMYTLELVSKQGGIDAPQRVALARPVIRLGTHSSCECVISQSGAGVERGPPSSAVLMREHRVATVHCLLFCPTHRHHGVTTKSTSTGSGTGYTKDGDQLTVVDNNSLWGTYVVSSAGTRKAPVKATAGMVLTSGLLLCLGVCKNGPSEISASEANQACVVYRVRCLEQEAV